MEPKFGSYVTNQNLAFMPQNKFGFHAINQNPAFIPKPLFDKRFSQNVKPFDQIFKQTLSFSDYFITKDLSESRETNK